MTEKIRVLYAEDDAHDADLTKTHFGLHAPEFEFELVDTGKKCLARLDEEKYDLLLLDNHLPDLDGIDVLKELAAREVALPVVMATAVGDEALVVQVLRLGAWDYVAKQSDYLRTLPAILTSVVSDYRRLEKQGQVPGHRQRRILYVEHHPADIDLTLNHFAKAAAYLNLEVVRSGQEALIRLQESRFDLLLTDLRMPDMSALDLLKESKYMGLSVPVIIITGKGDEGAAVAALKLGAYDYIVKRDNYLTQLPYAIDHAVARSELAEVNRRLQAELVERERAEESLRRLAAIVESSDDAIIGKSLSGVITSWNPGAERLYGYRAAEIIGSPISILIPSDRTGELPSIMERIKRGECVEHYETVRVAKGGRQIHVSLTVSPIFSEDGSLLGASAIARDVTARRRLEEQFLEAQKLESVGRLAGGVAHDFNNLLTVINGYAELALTRLNERDPLFRQIEEVKKAGERAASLTRQLLAYSRRQVLQPRMLDLNAVVASVTRMLQRLIGEDIELAACLDPALDCVMADPGQIEQVIMNLAVNARDAMPEGGKITIGTANVELDESYADQHTAALPGAYAMLAVSDTGRGMDPETQARIFEPFFTTKKEGEGTGLGLSTVYGIVKQSGGSIGVYSEPGKGSTFKVYLPRVQGHADRPEERSSLETIGGSETILLVEDESSVRKLVLAILKRAGYTVLEARNGREALLICESHSGPIHLMITDVVMPQMSGMELAGRLGSLRPGLKILFMSGYTDDAIVRHGVLEPDTPFLEKPFTPTSLAQKVRQTIDGSSGAATG